MKNLAFILFTTLLIGCSSSNDSSPTDSPSTASDNFINLPTWANGVYKVSNGLILAFPYPASYPYSIEFKNGNDFLIKGVSTSTVQSLQTKINLLKSENRLVSVTEYYNENTGTNYRIVISYWWPNTTDSSPSNLIYEISKTVEGKLWINYYDSGWDSGSDYILQ